MVNKTCNRASRIVGKTLKNEVRTFYSLISSYGCILDHTWQLHPLLTQPVKLPSTESAKISSPVENYTPIFVPAENDQNKQILTAKYRVIYSIPTEFPDLKTMRFELPTIKTWWYQSSSSFSPLFLSSLSEKILPGLWEGSVQLYSILKKNQKKCI